VGRKSIKENKKPTKHTHTHTHTKMIFTGKDRSSQSYSTGVKQLNIGL
jgi:hypothetical protein